MFYIKPPRGDILLNDLYDCVTTRINYFLNKYQNDLSISMNTINYEHLLMGTALDRIGHFTLRLLSAQSYLLKEFIPLCEANFMLERLEFLSADQIEQQIKTTLRHVDEIEHLLLDNDNTWIADIKLICIEMKSAFKSKHMLSLNHSESCKAINIKVPFQMCLGLIAKRELKMDRGNVIVPCGKWKLFMKSLLETHFIREINKIEAVQDKLNPVMDERFEDLKNVIISSLLKHSVNHKNKNFIGSTELDNHRKLFPPCMGHLYNNLKVNHRLRHNGRFNFSLFLKDIGMNLNESISFWRNEYSKPSTCVGKCSHSWQKDANKYTYSIRHLYGLEGKRAQYCSASCSKIQGVNLGPMEEGGCPFKTFDPDQLQNILDPEVVQNKEEFNKVLNFSQHNQALEACHHYRRTLSKSICERVDSEVIHHTPVEFFVLLKKDFKIS